MVATAGAAAACGASMPARSSAPSASSHSVLMSSRSEERAAAAPGGPPGLRAPPGEGFLGRGPQASLTPSAAGRGLIIAHLEDEDPDQGTPLFDVFA